MMGSTFSFASVFPRVATDNVADFHQSRVCIPWQITCYPVAGIDYAECIQHSFVPSSFAFAWQGSFLFLLIPWFIRCRMCRILTHMLGIAVASTCWYTVWNTMGSLGCICFRFDHLGIFQLIIFGFLTVSNCGVFQMSSWDFNSGLPHAWTILEICCELRPLKCVTSHLALSPKVILSSTFRRKGLFVSDFLNRTDEGLGFCTPHCHALPSWGSTLSFGEFLSLICFGDATLQKHTSASFQTGTQAFARIASSSVDWDRFAKSNFQCASTSVAFAPLETIPVLSNFQIYPARFHRDDFLFMFLYRIFDATKGFPGEGPTCSPPHKWKCISANIDSIQSNLDYQNWDHQVCFLQETRLTNLNFNANLSTVKQFGKHIFSGQLLKEKADKNGLFKAPHGGCAILAPQCSTRAFETKDDLTNLCDSLFLSDRVAAVWHQITKKIRVLCISFYGHSGVNENNNLEINDGLINNIFELCSQFGDIPIIFSGDFQADPDQYESVVRAKQTGKWFDPLVSCDADGNTNRPITYSRNSDFVNPSEYFSSIDAILLNSVAFAALTQMRVCHECSRPHAPIEAIFQWENIFQTGYVLKKPAAFDLSSIPKQNDKIDHDSLQNISETIWETKYHSRFQEASDDKAWKYINCLGKETLLTAGATLGKGVRTRGQEPIFEKKTVFPGQNVDGGAATNKSTKLAKVNRLVTELRFRCQRQPTTTEDFLNAFNLQSRVAKELRTIPECSWWSQHTHCCDDNLRWAQKCLQKAIAKNSNDEKRHRISTWKHRMINGTRSKNVSKFIYQWLKNKTQTFVPNLIRNADGDILYSPTEAIDEINNQWDDIFSANTLHNNPHDVLREIWPVVARIRNPTTLPSLTGAMLREQASKRRSDAAAGIDGWRTVETKILPLKVYDLIAEYFRCVENGTRQLPGILTTARQIILHKGGEDVPLQKRLISILPIFIITYTSLRFRHLQEWQNQTLPSNLFGGIQTRKMSQLQMHFRLNLDEAYQQRYTLIGAKLDKSKCFDRLLPDVSTAILIALGVPQTALRVFASLYGNLRRFLSYQSWTSHVPTTCANGVIQGCSFSLLAVNAHMTIWSLYLAALPGIHAASYIDDCYIWARIENFRVFQQALATTESWDKLTGQAANHRKSVAWSTNTRGRKLLKETFPDMQHHHIVEILGASMQTTCKKDTGWDKSKTTKAIRDLKLIRALPCSRDVHSHIAGVKVIPQITFAPHLNMIPKQDLQNIQDTVADLLWKNRPLWRSRGLVLALLANPCRVEPFAARAYRTIAECIQFLKHCQPTDRHRWANQCNHTQVGHSVVNAFREACTTLGLRHTSEFHFTYRDSRPICFLDFSPRELKSFLEALARQKCYEDACKSTRKDVNKNHGILDYHLTNAGSNYTKTEYMKGLELRCFRDSSVVGCTPTNDRRIKAGTSTTNMCRFCGQQIETLDHIINHCTSTQAQEDRPICPANKGPNFALLGIVEISDDLVRERLQCSDTSSIPVEPWYDQNQDTKKIWTDGSCIRSAYYWHTVGAFAVVDELGNCLHKGRVKHVALSSYSCELWAVIVAFCTATGPILISTDNEAVAMQVKQMIDSNKVDFNWQHYQWWNFLHQVYVMRKGSSNTPLQIRWIRAHLLEHLPCELISHEAAIKAGSTWEDIFCNRRADLAAKKCINTVGHDHCFEEEVIRVKKWQRWLAILNCRLSEVGCNPTSTASQNTCHENAVPLQHIGVTSTTIRPHEITIHHPISDFAALLPKWIWEPDFGAFNWKSSFPDDFILDSYATISAENWKIALGFLTSLRWVEGESHETSYVELAFLFWLSGLRFLNIEHSPCSYSRYLRKAINQSFKVLPNNPLTPGSQHSKCKCRGRVLPAGTLIHCYPYIEPHMLKHLAVHVLHGRSQSLKAWVSF